LFDILYRYSFEISKGFESERILTQKFLVSLPICFFVL